MFSNNLKIALRNLRKNKLFAFINIAGLALGMTVYVLGGAPSLPGRVGSRGSRSARMQRPNSMSASIR
jgi:hypothetical protein